MQILIDIPKGHIQTQLYNISTSIIIIITTTVKS